MEGTPTASCYSDQLRALVALVPLIRHQSQSMIAMGRRHHCNSAMEHACNDHAPVGVIIPVSPHAQYAATTLSA